MADKTTKIDREQEADKTLVGTAGADSVMIQESMRSRAAQVPGYIELLKTGRLLERIKSAEYLGEIGDSRGVLPLIAALEDPSPTVQYIAAKSLGLLADPQAVDPLIRLLKSGDKWVRIGAAHALGLIGDARAVPALIPVLDDPHHDLRAHAAWALGKLKAGPAREALKRMLSDPHQDVRSEAEFALDSIGEEKTQAPGAAPQDRPAPTG